MADVDRGLSTTLGYTLNLAIATILITGLLVASGGFVEGTQERAIRSELEVIGSRVAGDVSAADRLARTGSDTGVTITVSTPRRATGSTYTIAVNASGNDRITLSTSDPDVTIEVPYQSQTRVEPATVSGGTFTIRYGGGTGENITVVAAGG